MSREYEKHPHPTSRWACPYHSTPSVIREVLLHIEATGNGKCPDSVSDFTIRVNYTILRATDLGQGVDQAKEYFGGIDVDEELKDLFKTTVQKIKDLNLQEKWDKIKGKIDIDEILKKLGKTLQDGSKDLENYLNQLKNKYPEAKQELEKIEKTMMAAVRAKHPQPNNIAASMKPNFIMFLVVLQTFAYFFMI